MRILAIDPGPKDSGVVLWDEGVRFAEHLDNTALRGMICGNFFPGTDVMAIEMIASYGMAVGKETFETVLWTGRFFERAQGRFPVRLVYRQPVKLHLCKSPKANDSNVRQAILDIFGGKDAAIGKKAARGPLYGISGHLWAALAVALYVRDNPEEGV